MKDRCSKTDCFGNANGKCDVLTEALDDCSFYKTDINTTNGKRYPKLIEPACQKWVDIDGRKIRFWRKLNGYSQENFALALDVAQSLVSHWERNIKSIPIEFAERIAALTGMSLEELKRN